jgi:glycine dehydrogenase
MTTFATQKKNQFVTPMKDPGFVSRHIGPDQNEINVMLNSVGVSSMDELISQTIPSSIRLPEALNLPVAVSEYELLTELRSIASKNKVYRSYIGLGYHDCLTPGVILRNIFENPGWYTAYTPYQAEIAQGRLEALLNFQTMVTDLTGLDIANASLLDEATAAGEAMVMFFHSRSKDMETAGIKKFFVTSECFPQTIDVLKTRAEPLGIELIIGSHSSFSPDTSYFGMLLQYPETNGKITDYSDLVAEAKTKGLQVAVAADILSLALLKPPGEWGADAVVGTTQRLGVPIGYGGPHAGYIAARESFKREMPGRIIGVSMDNQGNRALRMALQTREQHIKRDKATSNICTSQVLLAVMAGMYCVYHGQQGIKRIAEQIHLKTVLLADKIIGLGYPLVHNVFFDTITIKPGHEYEIIRNRALSMGINFRYNSDDSISVSLNESTGISDLNDVLVIFSVARNLETPVLSESDLDVATTVIPSQLQRKSGFLEHEVFNTHHSETEMLRYIKKLENRDLSLNHSMIPLGSCTMKLNATTEMIPLSWPGFSSIHPFVPSDQAIGYGQILSELEKYLCEITGFYAVSLQPNSGAQGEFAGLMVIREYHKSRGESMRDVVLIPSSAHGTNPASAVLAGLRVVVVKCDSYGNIDMDDLRNQAEKYAPQLAALMITYPSTHGVFEESIRDINQIIHKNGGQVYMDGANMNAQVGLTNPALIGADVCHLNLHKTFSIPHGGGGPGMGPIGVARHLAPYLPSHTMVKTGGELGVSAVSAAPYGSASILLISYIYIRLMGGSGLRSATEMAILNANYMKSKLEKHFPILYQGRNGRVAHEMILDLRPFKISSGVDVVDVAKRLIDYGFHAPTVSFPVPGTMMIEPTESEAKIELDRFCDAMILIREEINEIESGLTSKDDNVLKNAPHTSREIMSDHWNHPYSRKKAVYPATWIIENKFWPFVGRVDNAFGDRNLVCTCPPLESYMDVIAQ